MLDSGETTFSLFASLLDSSSRGLISIPDLILQFEKSCRDVSETIRYGSTERHRIVEDRLMRQKAQLLLDEAASWSLLWYLSMEKEAKKFLKILFCIQQLDIWKLANLLCQISLHNCALELFSGWRTKHPKPLNWKARYWKL
ncbi:nuclear pore complex protein NUP107 isoform X3 [Spinacia oleracea]|uniref:Nuclear pore complex protein NUP107 isoform X3 n=1 Tax=Spinacia oleracea TaxID=3562 RepID=A0A9R0K624_SPIOL|nr:nuclear pore complex protein NUP107-like isoform X3 [Spinacia oleracea]XP_056696778.1 nuclear pore complex protein NUP107-like isoform X3 [Spinacia oleracea]XP_056696779.1 nuclear pore complex protein NUP107-like isoform X3 [Spinacia oleracea]